MKEILKQAIIVCEAIKRQKDPNGKSWVSPYLTVTCGSFGNLPRIEHLNEPFLNQIGALAIKKNAPFTVLKESNFRRVQTIFSDWMRKNNYRIYLNFENEMKAVTPREKIVAKFHLVNWLKSQGADGDWVIKYWRLDEK